MTNKPISKKEMLLSFAYVVLIAAVGIFFVSILYTNGLTNIGAIIGLLTILGMISIVVNVYIKAFRRIKEAKKTV